VGRLRERERDLAAVEELLEHRGGVLLIEGRAGIGKTSPPAHRSPHPTRDPPFGALNGTAVSICPTTH
jgi:hypothetical protein